MSKLPILRHPLKSTDLQRIIEHNGFVIYHKKGSSHITYRRGSYVFVFTNKGRGRESSPAQIREFKKLLQKIERNEKIH